MKRTLTLLAATVLVMSLAPAAFATDSIGIFYDEAGTINCSAAPAPYSLVTLYIVAKNISSTASGLSGWECSVIYDPPALMIPPSYTILHSMVNVTAAPNFQVGGFPVAYADAISLASIAIVYAGSPVKIGIGPGVPSSFGPGSLYPERVPSPIYAVGDDVGDLRNLTPVSNTDSGTPQWFWVCYLGVDAPCPGSPVGTEPNSWSGVKNLFK
jgi:hypothetical protein